jgi:hypothetical protein
MKLVALLNRIRLTDNPDTPGLSCSAEGLFLAGVPLVRGASADFELRSPSEIAALLIAAYGEVGELSRILRGLQATKVALAKGDVPRAMICAVHLRLPQVSREAASRVATVGDLLAKANYDPAELRDGHGRWTTGGAGSRLFQETTGDEDREPDSEPQGAEPEPRPPRAERDEIDPEINRPRLANGTPWPEATPDEVYNYLLRWPAGQRPVLRIYVPIDGRGPPLMGSTWETGEIEAPPDYREVTFYGRPQETQSGGGTTNHALDGVQQALDVAETGGWSEFYFNSAITTSTNGRIVSQLRPDVMAVSRPTLDAENPIYQPIESFSPGQRPADRATQLKLDPSIRDMIGRPYKKLLQALWTKIRRLIWR